MRKCDRCKKEYATVHLTEIKSGKRNERHLCEACARELKVPHNPSVSMKELMNVLMDKGQTGPETAGESRLKCPECGITFSEFKKKGRFGCANDYVIFRKELISLLEKIHDSTQYFGKVPSMKDPSPVNLRELISLRQRLKDVVKSERYEEAARIRDRSLEIEKIMGGRSEEEETR